MPRPRLLAQVIKCVVFFFHIMITPSPGVESQVTLVGGKCSNHYTIPAPLIRLPSLYSYHIFYLCWACSRHQNCKLFWFCTMNPKFNISGLIHINTPLPLAPYIVSIFSVQSSIFVSATHSDLCQIQAKNLIHCLNNKLFVS